jgi:hypothetical protein
MKGPAMKRLLLLFAAGVSLLSGCWSTPKRQMRIPAEQEFAVPPAHQYTSPPDLPRDQPLLTPKGIAPALNTGPGGSNMGAGAPRSMPGSAPGMAR